MLTDVDVDDHYNPSVRLLEVEKCETVSCGFHLTRSKWDPYPWISGVDNGSAADNAGMRTGDCLLEVNGEDVIGQRISEIAQLVKAHPTQTSFLIWNAGADAQCSPETLCCGPMPNNFQKLSACMSSILTCLECPVCLDTTSPPTYQCEHGHLICMRCRSKSERCPVCRTRFERGRSLLADQVYNAIMDVFELRGESQEVRSAKMQQIFKLKNKNKGNIPGIKVTPAHTQKFLARLIGKSSSVDNLSSKSESGSKLMVDNEFSADLRTKSLSSSEIFIGASPIMSRTASINSKLSALQAKNDGELSGNHLLRQFLPKNNVTDSEQYYCPFQCDCSVLIKGREIIEHFRSSHNGPLIQYFNGKIRLKLNTIDESNNYILNYEERMFFLKITKETATKNENVRIWVWLLGTKQAATNFHLQIRLFNEDTLDNVLLSVGGAIYSLAVLSWSDIKEKQKGVFISAQTLLAISSINTLVEVDVSKFDM